MTQIDRTEWLRQRQTGIGGSDVAAILGLSPYATPYDIYLAKTEPVPETEDETEYQYWGSVLEDVVAKEFRKRSGQKVQRVNQTLRHPEHDFALANIDRAVVNPEISGLVRWRDGRLTTDQILECKTSSAFMAHEWGKEGTDAVPDYYLIQTQWYLGISQCRTAHLAVLIGGSDYRIYTISRDDALIRDLIDTAGEFWARTQQGIAPDPQSIEDAKRRWPRHMQGKTEIAGPDVAHAAREIARLEAKIKDLEAQRDHHKTEIMSAMGDAEAIEHGGQRLATWKHQTAERIDTKALREDHPEIAAMYLRRTDSRVFRLAPAVRKEIDE